MNCKDVQELLPLYAGRDLEEKRAKLVKAHVQSCAECARSEDEYRESRHLLQMLEAPQVGEAVYAGIRQRVLREIERESASSLPQFVAGIFRPRFRLAVATVLLLAVFGLAFYFIANRKPNLNNDGQQLAANGATVDQAKGDKEQDAQPQRTGSDVSHSNSPKETDRPHLTNRNRGAGTTHSASARHTQQFRKKGTEVASDRTQSVAVDTPDNGSMAAGIAPEGNNPADPDALPARDPATSEKTLRVEIQTKDQNIRIIWFSHPPAKQDSPRKSFKGIPEVRSDA